MALAPAAGAGIGKVLADTLLAETWFLPAMVQAIRNGLHAERTFFVKGGGTHSEPDAKVQLQAFALVMSHMEGEPIKRVIHQHLGATGAVDPLAALRESPALAQALRRELEKLDWRTSGQQPHKRPGGAGAVVEIE